MNQRSVDPEVQAVRLVRRRPMSASNSAPQTTVRWVNADCTVIRKSNQLFFFLKSHWKRDYFFCKLSWDRARLSIDEKPKQNKGDNNWKSPCTWMVCSALWLIHQISMNSIKATAPSQDFCDYKQCRYRSSFSFCDWQRIWRRLNCSPLKPLTCSCIDFSLPDRPWLRGVGEKCVGHEGKCLICQLKIRFL